MIHSSLRFIIQKFAKIRWIRFGIRDRIARAFNNPDRAIHEAFEVDFFGTVYPGSLSTFLDWNVFYFGAYCIEELECMSDAVQGIDDSVIVDIGANVGHHSLYASTVAKVVHAFEPFPQVARNIREKIKVNGLKNLILHPVGLGDTDSELPYVQPNDCNTGTGTFVAASNNDSLYLPVRNADNYFQKNSIDKISFIKIDVEGFEGKVLQGLRKSVESSRPVVFFEWTENSIAQGLVVERLFPAGYHFFDFESDQNIFLVFAITGYRLKVCHGNHQGNKLAIPTEKLRLFERHIES
jgi:FkbM family methyltransferase